MDMKWFLGLTVAGIVLYLAWKYYAKKNSSQKSPGSKDLAAHITDPPKQIAGNYTSSPKDSPKVIEEAPEAPPTQMVPMTVSNINVSNFS